MTRRLYHPLWTHLPAMLLLVAMAVASWRAWPLPARVPLHFNFAGYADRYGSPWEFVLVTMALVVLFIGISILLDELWARQETRKAYNWLSFFDDIFIAFYAAIFFHALDMFKRGDSMLPFPWVTCAIFVAGAGLFAHIVEYLRPYHPHPRRFAGADNSAVFEELKRQMAAGQRWCYWETQNPRWMNLLVVGLDLLYLTLAVLLWGSSAWSSLFFLVVALLITLLYGGMHVRITPKELHVRLGILGIPLLRIAHAEIDTVMLHDFSPLKDFGGYGIRFNREMKAYFMRGNRGVKIRLRNGKQYLIGSDQPERLYAVMTSARELHSA